MRVLLITICGVLAHPSVSDIDDAINKMSVDIDRDVADFKEGKLKVDEKTKKEVAQELADAESNDSDAPADQSSSDQKVADTPDSAATPDTPDSAATPDTPDSAATADSTDTPASLSQDFGGLNSFTEQNAEKTVQSDKKAAAPEDKIQAEVAHMKENVMNEYEKFEAMRGQNNHASFAEARSVTHNDKKQATVLPDGSVSFSGTVGISVGDGNTKHETKHAKHAKAPKNSKVTKDANKVPKLEDIVGDSMAQDLFKAMGAEQEAANKGASLLEGKQGTSAQERLEKAFQEGYASGMKQAKANPTSLASLVANLRVDK